MQTNTDGILSHITNPVVIDNNNSKRNYFISGPNQGADRKANVEVT